MNIELLNQTLKVTDNPGLEIFDPRFNDIATLIQQGNYSDAAVKAEEIIEEGIYDIRIIGYFLHGVFIEQGVSVLPAVFRSLISLLTENWEAMGPSKKKEKHTQTSLNWFTKQLFKTLNYEEDKKSSNWNVWVKEVSSDDVEEALEVGEELRRALGTTLEDGAGSVLDGLTKIKDWLTAFQRVVYREPEPEIEEVEQESESKTPMPALSDGEETVSTEGSYHLKLLLKKIMAFEQLIENEKFSMATLIVDDINEIIANFDPRVYFPKIFSKFSLLLALNIGELASYEEQKQTVEWKCMKDLYKVDIDSFVSFDSDINYSTPMPTDKINNEENQDEDNDDEDFD